MSSARTESGSSASVVGIDYRPASRGLSLNSIPRESAISLHAPPRRAGSNRALSAVGVNAAHAPSDAGASRATESALHSANAVPCPPAAVPTPASSATLNEHVFAKERLAIMAGLLNDGEELGDADDRLLEVLSIGELLRLPNDRCDLGIAALR